MSENTKIEWCDYSASPWRGCAKVSPGCAHCYAEGMAKRYGPKWGGWGKGAPRILAKSIWHDAPLWNRTAPDLFRCPTCRTLVKAGHACVEEGHIVLGSEMNPAKITVFPSLCDWLDEEVPIEWLARFLKLIHETPNLTWLLLTKRPENFFPRLEHAAGCAGHNGETDNKWSDVWEVLFDWIKGTPPSNVWIGTSVENQEWADKRIPHLLMIPAVGRFLSVEPMLGPIEFSDVTKRVDSWKVLGRPALEGIDWVIYGGESGPGARPCNVDWIRDGVRQCKAAGVAPFVKQLGAHIQWGQFGGHQGTAFQSRCAGGVAHPKGGDPAEWPEELRVREFPPGLL